MLPLIPVISHRFVTWPIWQNTIKYVSITQYRRNCGKPGMNNPFQEQLLKAGLVTKQQVHKAQKDKHKKNKQNHSNKNSQKPDEAALKSQQAAKDKADRDRELNRKKEDHARKKAISAEINQLILKHRIERPEDCDLVYNFQHRNKVMRIYINNDLKQKMMQGSLVIARIDGRYELVPESIAKKIQQRNENRVVLFDEQDKAVNEDDPYADYQIPDDLTW